MREEDALARKIETEELEKARLLPLGANEESDVVEEPETETHRCYADDQIHWITRRPVGGGHVDQILGDLLTAMDCTLYHHSCATMSLSDRIHNLIDLQNFDGLWSIGDNILILLDITKEQLSAAFPVAYTTKIGVGFGRADRVQAIIATIAFLKGTEEQDVWETNVEKAIAWVERVSGGGFDDEIVEIAKWIDGRRTAKRALSPPS